MNFEKLGIGIRKYHKPDNTSSIISAIENMLDGSREISWNPSRIQNGNGEYVVDTQVRYNVYFWLNPAIAPNEDAKNAIINVESMINNELQECLQHYQSEVGVGISKQEPYELLKYNESHFLEWHTDDGSADRSRVSMLYYLNDEYEGGELEFANFDILLKPKKGDILIFPSSFIYKHRVRKVTNGTRYVIADFMA